MSFWKNADELLKAFEILLKSQIGYECRQRLPTQKFSPNVEKIIPQKISALTGDSDYSDVLDRLKVIGIGIETFTKLMANGVFPGYGGYEVTDPNESNFPKAVKSSNRTNNSFFNTSTSKNNNQLNDLTAEEEEYLLKAAKEVGVVFPKTHMTSNNHSVKNQGVNIMHEVHIPRIPQGYEIANSKFDAMLKGKERRVPSSRIGRLTNFGILALGLGSGAAAEITRRTVGASDSSAQSPFLTAANAERIVETLCRVRGAALKIGQMLSIQDEETVSPYLQQIFERVRQSADFMPLSQVHSQLKKELGVDWQNKFKEFNDRPFAAASIGQVHKAIGLDGKPLAVKIQYPGVANSIDSDINNLLTLLNIANFFPRGMFLEKMATVARREFKDECDYEREARAMVKFRDLLQDYNDFYVPKVYEDLSTKHVLTTEYVIGKPIDQCVDDPQEVRDYIAVKFFELCVREIFQFRFLQSDPNWSNFLLGKHPQTNNPCLVLLDFGASRTYSKAFIDKYMKILRSAYNGNIEDVLKYSREIGFLTGFESKMMEKAHCQSIMILSEILTAQKPYDFSTQNITKRINQFIPVMLEHRLTAPPEEIYSLHRKLSGCYLTATKLKAVVSCGSFFQEICNQYEYDGEDIPINIGNAA